MALDNKKIQEAKKLLSDIEKAYKAIGGVNPFKNIKAANSDLNDLKDGLADANTYLGLMDTKGSELVSSFKSINEEVTNTGSTYKDSLKSLNSLTSIAGKLRDSQQGINHLSSKQLSQLKSKAQSEQANLKINQSQLQSKIDNNTATDKEIGMLANINGLLNEKDSALEGIIASTQKEAKERKKIEKSLGVTGGVLKGIGKIPILGDLVDTSQALDAAEKKGGGVKGFGAAIGSLGKQSLSGLLNSSNLILGAFTMIGKTIMDMDKGAGAFAKDMNITYSEALKVREEMTTMAVASGDVGLSATKLLKTTSQVAGALGTNAQLNEKDLKTMTKLTNQAGFTADELMNIQKLSLANGKSLEDNTKEILGGAKEYARRNKIAVNEKTILKEVNNMSASLKLSLGGSGDAMARSAVQAKQFGINLKQAESIANSLLDFESSIESELSAELITGKSLNLEKARGLALAGKSTEAAAAMLEQVGSSAEFGDMNVLQQQEIAKAMGMQKDELAASLIESEALAAMSAKEGESALQAYDRLKASGKTEKEIVKILGEKAAKNLEAQSNQSKFNASIEKLKDIFVQVGDVLMPIFDVLGTIAEVIIPVITMAFSGLGKILSGSFEDLSGWETVLGSIALIAIGIATTMKTIALINTLITFAKETQAKSTAMQSLGEKKSLVPLASRLSLMVAQAAAWVIMNPVASIVGLGLAAGAGALIYSQMKDGVIGPGGETIVSGPKGSIQVDKDDSMIVGTDLGGKKKPAGDSGGSVNIDLGPTNALLQQLISAVNAGGSISIDGQKVGEALKLGTYKTQ